ncbi:nucleotide disphospho-sugar-binding domain-containing protein [Streptomyces sp. NPDC000345]|uniref:nucleotide disphospho-sugar-binding domain-containing protein n=1 Tax=Streptomyces sp. NPDC000345 TaxID=3364537 RepID=UPI003692B261
MRVLFTTFPSESHLHALVPLAWACRAAGHEVIVASTPALAPAIVSCGLPAVPVGRDVDLAALSTGTRLAAWHDADGWPQGWTERPGLLGARRLELLENLAGLQFAIAATMAPDLVAFARVWRPDVVVNDAVTYAGPVAAAVLGVPCVSQLWGSPGVHRLEMRGLGTEPLPGYADLFARFGAPVVDPVAWIDPCPGSLQYAHTLPAWQSRYVHHNGAARIPPWVLARPERPRICLTWGQTTAQLLGRGGLTVFGKAVRALGELDAEVVLVTTAEQAGQLGDLPDNTRAALSLPLHALLPGCAAIVHHGGSGTAMTAVNFGVPQLTVTRRPEPGLAGERLAAAGVGRHLTHSRVENDPHAIGTLRDEAGALLTEPAYRKAAEELRREALSRPAPAQLVARLATIGKDPR